MPDAPPPAAEALRGIGRAAHLLAVAATIGLSAGSVHTGPTDGPGADLTGRVLMIAAVLLAIPFGLNLIFRLWMAMVPLRSIARGIRHPGRQRIDGTG